MVHTIVVRVPDAFDEFLAPNAGPITDARRRAYVAALLAEFADLLERPQIALAIATLNDGETAPETRH